MSGPGPRLPARGRAAQARLSDVTALDIADEGLAAARRELGPDAYKITWVTADLLTWSPPHRFDIWHDRAVFHSLTTPAQQRRYLTVAEAALHPAAKMIIATFVDDGPQQCSGLPVARYSPAQLVDTLNAHSTAFELLTTGAKNTARPGRGPAVHLGRSRLPRTSSSAMASSAGLRGIPSCTGGGGEEGARPEPPGRLSDD